MQNLNGGEGRTRCIMGDVQMENGLNTVGPRVSYFCLKQIEAVFLVKKILKELCELYLLPKRSKLIKLICMNSCNSYWIRVSYDLKN